MEEKILTSKKVADQSAQEKLALNYLSKYIKELQLHFNLSDESIKNVLHNATSSIKSKNTINKILDMLKSYWW